MGRIDRQVDPAGTIDFDYDDSGNLTTVTEGSVTLTRAYDNRDRVTSHTDAHGDTIGYQYDSNGNLTRLTYPGGKAVDYAYDARNQLISVTDWNGRVTSYSYDLKGRLTTVSRHNGTQLTMAYDAADQITKIEERKADGRLFLLHDFAYDDAGRISREFMAPIPSSFDIPTKSVTYDADNRIATFNGLTVTHDVDGNMTSGPLDSDNLETYSYDARNRLAAVAGTSYAFDPEGNRISTTDPEGTTKYTVDPNSGLSKVLIRTKPDGTKTYYVYGIGLLYQVDASENTLTYHYDYRGSTRFLVADDGQIVTDTFEYSPYGEVTDREGTTKTPFQYNGFYGVMTDGNGLLLMRARFYNTYIQRFINADPIGFSGGLNWYAYADGDPISYLDPYGLDAWTRVWGGVQMIGGAVETLAGVSIAVATSPSGVGPVGGTLIATHGVDTFIAGGRQLFSGERTDTFTSQAIQSTGVSRNNANLIDAGIGMTSGGASISTLVSS